MPRLSTVFLFEHVGSGQDCFSCLHDHGQETLSLLCVCRDNWTVVAGPCGPQAAFSPWAGQSWKEAVHTCLPQAAVFPRASGFCSCLKQSREQGGRRLKEIEIFV